MLNRTSGGDNDTELNELTVAPIRVPSFVRVVTTATPVGKSPRASRKLRSVNVIWRAPFWSKDSSAGVADPKIPSTSPAQASVTNEMTGALDKIKWGAAFVVMIVWFSIVLFGKTFIRKG